ncbi:hypothetical protein BC833DRAFT_588670 [Globomyces pollinis-pini]|nr:hypothetical protein BC833DRAFT_588670 [Globomyces pollinis-pini]
MQEGYHRESSVPILLVENDSQTSYHSLIGYQKSPNSSFKQSFVLPNELLLKVFKYLKTNVYLPIPLLPFTVYKTFLNLALVSKQFATLALPILHRFYYNSKVHPRTGLKFCSDLQKEDHPIWSKICAVSLACLYRHEWGIGAPRLFYINNSTNHSDLYVISQFQNTYPNPKSSEWNQIIACSMDIHDCFNSLLEESHVGLLDSQEHISMLLRYSERMDIGSYLHFIRLPSGCVLFRCKPIGTETEEQTYGSGEIIVWDALIFGTCTLCSTRLLKLQVCADCRVTQYCSRDCQRKDWERGHRRVCKALGFHPIFSDVTNEDEDNFQLNDVNNEETATAEDVEVDTNVNTEGPHLNNDQVEGSGS